MKRFESPVFLTALLCGTLCLFPSITWAKGGGSRGGSVRVSGYTRSNGTYVNSYTRSAPGSSSRHRSNSSGYGNQPIYSSPLSETSSGYSNDPVSSQAEPKPSPVPLNNLGDHSEKSPPQVVNRLGEFSDFPLPKCGDKPIGVDDVWYPVFIDGGNLDKVRRQYCADAVGTVREETKVKSVQVASFNTYEKALRFASLVRGEVGKPTYPDNVEQITNKKEAETASVAVSPSPTASLASSSQATLPSPPSQESASGGWLVWMFLALLSLGIWLKFRKASRRGISSSPVSRQALSDAAIEAELEALRKQNYSR